MRKVLLVVLLVIAVVGLGGIVFLNTLDSPLDPDSTAEINVEIPEGTGVNAIGDILESNGVISSAFKFKLYNRISNHEGVLKAGSYTLSPSMDLGTIFDTMINATGEDVEFYLPEGLTIEQTAQKLADQGVGTYEGFMDAIENGTYDYSWLNGNSPEGYLLPDTYRVAKGSSETQIIDFLLKQFEQTVLPVYDSANQEIKDKYSLNEIVTVASIIERECKVEDERAKVASVIYNRLDQGIKLEMCSTVQYLLLKETGEVKETLLNSDLQIESPYNTYQHFGLPPAPICSPGIASLKAALEPADTEYLYFVLSSRLDGTSEFSRDYSKFLKDKDAYYEALNKANG